MWLSLGDTLQAADGNAAEQRIKILSEGTTATRTNLSHQKNLCPTVSMSRMVSGRTQGLQE